MTSPLVLPNTAAALASIGELMKPESDYDRYQRLIASLKRGKTLEHASSVWQEIEAIKNRHAGLPPKSP